MSQNLFHRERPRVRRERKETPEKPVAMLTARAIRNGAWGYHEDGAAAMTLLVNRFRDRHIRRWNLSDTKRAYDLAYVARKQADVKAAEDRRGFLKKIGDLWGALWAKKPKEQEKSRQVRRHEARQAAKAERQKKAGTIAEAA